ncbi:dehydrogenase [Streptomyces sp. NBC_00414]|uniref:dehydrogenase n=1 Tax=Streptomyces sp. NBC_00414 TaxID=2975739 RepID=UPI002E1D9AFF
MSTEARPLCPECGGQLKAGGMVLCKREDDGRRVCRLLWKCVGRHVWWTWSDRPGDELEPCPHPQLFGG